jgi:hypothetical protein
MDNNINNKKKRKYNRKKPYARKAIWNIPKPKPFNLESEDLEFIQRGKSLFNIEKEEVVTANCQLFKCNKYQFKVSFRNGFGTKTFGEATEQLTEMFTKLHSDILQLMRNKDKVRVVLFHDSLAYPIGYSFMDKEEFVTVNLEDTFFQVIQSYTTVLIESGSSLQADITIARLPSGGTNRPSIQFESEQDMIDNAIYMEKIVNHDMYCSIRSVLVAIAFYENHQHNFKDTGRKATTFFEENKSSEKILHYLREQHEYYIKPEINRFLNKFPEFKKNRMIGLEIFPKLEEYFNYEYQITVIGFGLTLKNGESFTNHTNIYIGDNQNKYKKSIYILHTSKHYDCIKHIKSFYKCYSSEKGFCDLCKIPYYKGSHNCIGVCHYCQRTVCIIETSEKNYNCEFCQEKCKNIDCYRLHLKRVCKKAKICNVCNTTKQKRHVCIDEKYCSNCKSTVKMDHLCYILTEEEKIKTNKKKENQCRGYIFYDYECYEDKNNGGIHVPNLVKANKMCVNCIFSKNCLDGCTSGFETFWNNEDFCDWLFDKKHKGYTAIAHNFKGYDGILVLDYIKRKRTGFESAPDLLMNGTKIMTMTFRGIRFIDSLNFIQFPLEKFPDAFGLIEMKKGYFPHKFNHPNNINYIGVYPAIEYYQHTRFSSSKKAKFEEWYYQNNHKVFNFKKELEEYCESDVKLLKEGCLQYRQFIFGISGVEPLAEVITLASMTHLIFRKLNMIPSTIPIIPEKGYNSKQIYSKISMLWLKYVANTKKIHINHRLNGGEKKIGKYYVDGICEETKTIYEFLGCFWHGCPKCYDPSTFNNRLIKLFGTIFIQTHIRLKEIAKLIPEYTIKHMWECDFKRLMKSDTLLVDFQIANHYVEPIDPRNCMYGGRTNALKLYCKAEANEKIKYYDYKSLYPSVQKYKIYPTGHPEIITENFQDIKNYFGIIKCTILPPQNIFHPVLPMRMHGKLLFPLCYTCALKLQDSCNHDTKERSLTGTWVTLEVMEAIENGYTLIQIHEVWHYKTSMIYDKDKKEGGLF